MHDCGLSLVAGCEIVGDVKHERVVGVRLRAGPALHARMLVVDLGGVRNNGCCLRRVIGKDVVAQGKMLFIEAQRSIS